jgi:hypothetical protein
MLSQRAFAAYSFHNRGFTGLQFPQRHSHIPLRTLYKTYLKNYIPFLRQMQAIIPSKRKFSRAARDLLPRERGSLVKPFSGAARAAASTDRRNALQMPIHAKNVSDRFDRRREKRGFRSGRKLPRRFSFLRLRLRTGMQEAPSA